MRGLPRLDDTCTALPAETGKVDELPHDAPSSGVLGIVWEREMIARCPTNRVQHAGSSFAVEWRNKSLSIRGPTCLLSPRDGGAFKPNNSLNHWESSPHATVYGTSSATDAFSDFLDAFMFEICSDTPSASSLSGTPPFIPFVIIELSSKCTRRQRPSAAAAATTTIDEEACALGVFKMHFPGTAFRQGCEVAANVRLILASFLVTVSANKFCVNGYADLARRF
ncbi:hypothetical protein MOQ_003120 [Trypanosoma cruzi marinkellei]|uniref:Uncharacterized protein n=1 Tax=Trypanosoma cruzi marinkellei TaxID=85056 RepID=K2N0S0_TRYCR|nr:hypothetical protein MOQ_003120 [Trypanosoma cruzi marinkellei]